MAFSTDAKNEALDGITVDLISLHSGDPGASGTSNEASGGGYARTAATFNAAASGERTLNADVEFTGTADAAVTYIGFWENDVADVFKGSIAVTGDQAFNADGEYVVKATTTKLTLT